MFGQNRNERSGDTEMGVRLRPKYTVFWQKFENTYVATNGTAIIYANKNHCGKLFLACHQFIEYSVNATNEYTDKTRLEYLYSNQAEWNAFSQQTVNNAAQLLDTNHELKTILSFLGQKRQVIAQKLKHGLEVGRSDAYGNPRYYYHSFEEVSLTSFWSNLYPQISKRVTGFKKDFRKINANCSIYPYDAGYADRKEFMIEYWKYKELIKFIHPKIVNEEDFNDRLNIIKPDFDKLLQWDGININEFIKNIARISHSLYRLQPFQLGTSAIVHWLSKAVATYKGIDLGNQHQSEKGLSPDWEAFLTADKEQYALWFLERVYQRVQRISVTGNHEQKEEPVTSISTTRATRILQRFFTQYNESPETIANSTQIMTSSI